jgi:hypothetical protein
MAYCLASFKHNEKSLRRLWEFKGCLAGAVRESEDVAETLANLVTKSRTNPALKDALKVTETADSGDIPMTRMLDLLEAKVELWRTGGDAGDLEVLSVTLHFLVCSFCCLAFSLSRC